MYDMQKHPVHTKIQQHTYRRKFIIYCNTNCKTENIIYLLECAICDLQYIGETKQQLGKRNVSNNTVKNIFGNGMIPIGPIEQTGCPNTTGGDQQK
jgi:hypothetical protein